VFHVLKSTYLQPPDVIEKTRPAHLAWLQEQVDKGHLILAGRQEDGSGGMLITGDMDDDAAQRLVAADPYTKARAARYERTSFNGAFRAPGL
jgi:uncharacterized protein YciI